jgi:elongation factor Ts
MGARRGGPPEDAMSTKSAGNPGGRGGDDAEGISPKKVMDLRAATGLPMMKCKEALIAEKGDFEKAMERLRKEGLKTADAKAGRATGQGVVRTKISSDGKSGAMVCVLCETEPVAKTKLFNDYVDGLLSHVEAKRPDSVLALTSQVWAGDAGSSTPRTADEVRRGLVAKIGENVVVSGVWRFDVKGPGLIGSYVHHDGLKGSMVAVGAERVTPELQETARQLAMHAVFARPVALERGDVPRDLVSKEREILREQTAQDPKMKGKPPQVIEKIVEGKVDAFYKERVLAEQPWFKDPSKNVTQMLQPFGAKVQAYAVAVVGAA